MDKYILGRFLGFFMLGTASEIGVARVAWEGDDIADVGHTGDKQHKAFYMKQNEDGKTVRGMDVLFPKIGEIIGGSEREASLEKLEQRIDELKMSRKNLEWYIDTRRYGTVPHSGFGLGFERLLLFVTGMANIRDVIPFPRTPKNAEF